jgi:hypothetical protein
MIPWEEHSGAVMASRQRGMGASTADQTMSMHQHTAVVTSITVSPPSLRDGYRHGCALVAPNIVIKEDERIRLTRTLAS